MCGIVGVSAASYVNQAIFDALTVLQHRGQDAAGIVTCHEGRFFMRKDNGLVKDVFRTRHMKRMAGVVGIGHVRYPTAGSSHSAEAQPFYVNSPYGMALAHNGNLTNADAIKNHLFRTELRHINTHSDSEILLNVFAHELQQLSKLSVTPNDIFTAVERVYARCEGGYAVVSVINGYGLVGFRDSNGIRPLVFGERDVGNGKEYMIASESVALDVLGFRLIRDVYPGEAIYIDQHRQLHTRQCVSKVAYTPCIFEYVYFARPDSILDDISVYKSRIRMGQKLADKILLDHPDHDIDVVIPIPDTSRTAALELATQLGVVYREGFVKNRYIGRTFIMSGQTQRKRSIRQKLNAIDLEFVDKNVLLVDDSIVRGTTCKQIIEMARDAGAKKVYFCSAAPAVRFPNVYGIDMPTKSELIAHGQSDKEVGQQIGADWLIYQALNDLIEAVRAGNPNIETFDCSVFDGKYLTGDIDEAYLNQLAMQRNDSVNLAHSDERESEVIDIHNESA
ncbi:MAG: amidophosphoribosyltransferase [Endozoicomonadaceae bacterium]|nr:amidophosphoribosyltransferase [Endozoicomonadaceae bacterium]